MIARCEVFLQNRRQLVDAYLDKITGGESLSDINKAVRYSLLAGGKRLRPLLLMAAAEAAGSDSARFLPVACGLEMIHAYSLIHDDLPAMDDDDYRRGRLSCHKVFGEAKAILAGDALLTRAFEVMLGQGGVPPDVLVKAVKEIAFCAGAEGMVGGQTIDIEAERVADRIVSVKELQEMHMAKTGALFRAAVFAGAMLAGASDARLTALEDYAGNFGLAFQITDDILDVTGDPAAMGKKAGSDARKNKITYVSAFGLGRAKELAREHIGKAVLALSPFGAQADYLRFLAESMLERKN
ncbi:MAG: polyprenyl synthetase family protein [Acidaminococcales bacterium]|jgi:geranylgeranyl diphosphate synthase type II|nr:polyprenyl synthetase family protein [Acidaminococcales bacterium]